LDSLQQTAFPPLFFEPLHWNLGQSAFGIAATAAPADRKLADDQALRFQRTIGVPVHGLMASPEKKWQQPFVNPRNHTVEHRIPLIAQTQATAPQMKPQQRERLQRTPGDAKGDGVLNH
jgi:hypothetical protein